MDMLLGRWKWWRRWRGGHWFQCVVPDAYNGPWLVWMRGEPDTPHYVKVERTERYE